MHSDEVATHGQLLTSSEIEGFLSDDLKQKRLIASLEQPFSATSLLIAKSSGASYTLTMTDWSQPDKVLLYKAMIAAYNFAFFSQEASLSAKDTFASSARPFVEWLNVHTIDNRYEILKQYESDRMDAVGNHGGRSPLIKLMIVVTYAIDSVAFRDEVSASDYGFIRELRRTKISPNLNKTQKSIASYFGELDWLRRDDIGIGKDLYSALASPKLTVKSLSLTAATIILELNNYKSALKLLVQKAQPKLSKLIETDFSSLSKSRKAQCIGNILYHIISEYHQNSDNSELSKAALDVLLLSNATNEKAYLLLLGALTSPEACDELFLNKRCNKKKIEVNFCVRNITTLATGNLFSLKVLRSLFHDESQVVTAVENMMFGWLMASLTVQPYDIEKLTHSSFRKMIVGGRVTSIECEYFKGRAKVFHTTRSLSVRETEGQALMTYIEAVPEGTSFYIHPTLIISNGMRSITGSLRHLLQCHGMKTSLLATHRKKNTPLIIPSAYCALVKSGIHPENVIENAKLISIEERIDLVINSESPCRNGLFGLQAIKNSAVHAFSDPYTYHYLVNRNSHTNKTEKISYLTEDNEEWMNSAGRITREVMFDLIQNVFYLDFNPKQIVEMEAFNSEFMVVSENISYRTEEMNARMRLVTGQARGRVNEVGVLALSDKIDDEPLSPIYVLDSPLTVLRMHNYLHEFKKHYKKLLATNPDFLFKTVMPTVEWIEGTLGKMSKYSQKNGREQFDEMIKHGVVMSVFHSL
ncbi:hypothetical protein HJ080_11490 [Vibrio parahaemolyticus]|nr:hypothetical protein [Vibrio parahaemolyticus]MBE4256718.1 hypothetical protein [Vibrio parahaemolyticus]